MQDMGIQPKFREQKTNPLFADDRAMRPTIPGTVRSRIAGDGRQILSRLRAAERRRMGNGRWHS